MNSFIHEGKKIFTKTPNNDILLTSETSIINLFFDKDSLLVLSSWFSNISAGWFGSIFILPLLTDSNPLLLLTVNLPSAIVFLLISIWLDKKGRLK